MGEHSIFIGLNVHKETIMVALAASGGHGDVREYGRIANTPEALTRLAAKLQRVGGDLRFCYEAGPCGYGIHGYKRRDAVSDWALAQCRRFYKDASIMKEDVFWYVYGILHSPEYKSRVEAAR